MRANERDLLYVTAWRSARFGTVLGWPESEATTLAFILDQARDLCDAPEEDIARQTAEAFISQRLSKSLACPTPSTLNRRTALCLAFYRMKNLSGLFALPQVKQARAKALRAATRPPAPKSSHHITRDALDQMLAACRGNRRDCHDRALLMLGWASGGRRRSETTGLKRADVAIKEFDKISVVWISLLKTKTTQ